MLEEDGVVLVVVFVVVRVIALVVDVVFCFLDAGENELLLSLRKRKLSDTFSKLNSLEALLLFPLVEVDRLSLLLILMLLLLLLMLVILVKLLLFMLLLLLMVVVVVV